MGSAEEGEACYICLQGSDAGALKQPCKCPRVVHDKCLARWQLQSAGRAEERSCRFCNQLLPDWRPILTPPGITPSVPVVSVHYNSVCYRLRVRPGPDGLEHFRRQLQKITGMSMLECMQITFQCKAPGSAADLSFKGIGAFDAAIHCAGVSAAERAAHTGTRPDAVSTKASHAHAQSADAASSHAGPASVPSAGAATSSAQQQGAAAASTGAAAAPATFAPGPMCRARRFSAAASCSSAAVPAPPASAPPAAAAALVRTVSNLAASAAAATAAAQAGGDPLLPGQPLHAAAPQQLAAPAMASAPAPITPCPMRGTLRAARNVPSIDSSFFQSSLLDTWPPAAPGHHRRGAHGIESDDAIHHIPFSDLLERADSSDPSSPPARSISLIEPIANAALQRVDSRCFVASPLPGATGRQAAGGAAGQQPGSGAVRCKPSHKLQRIRQFLRNMFASSSAARA